MPSSDAEADENLSIVFIRSCAAMPPKNTSIKVSETTFIRILINSFPDLSHFIICANPQSSERYLS
jgi:hypothetical protein